MRIAHENDTIAETKINRHREQEKCPQKRIENENNLNVVETATKLYNAMCSPLLRDNKKNLHQWERHSPLISKFQI